MDRGERLQPHPCRNYPGSIIINYALVLSGLCNLASFFAYCVDKSKARREVRRISESRLLQLSFFGPLGSIPGIWWIRHKTHKTSYLIRYFAVLTLSLAFHAGVVFLMLRDW